MTEHKFSEVFPTLKLKGNLPDKLKDVVVERVSATKQLDRMTLILRSTVLLSKSEIRTIEQEMKRQLFGRNDMELHIIERFRLSTQYTPENLLEVYGDSILQELEEYNHIIYTAFRRADKEFVAPNTLIIRLEDTVLNHGVEEKLQGILEKIYTERFGFSTTISMEYKEPVALKHTYEEEVRIQLKVDEIYRRTKGKKSNGEGMDAASTSEQSEPINETKKAVDTTDKNRKNKETGAKNGGEKSLKKSDHPDVLYGKEIHEEAIPIEDILGEMGNVTIRGKIVKCDKRETRKANDIVTFDVTDFTDTISVKLFVDKELVNDFVKTLKVGSFVKVMGRASLDDYDHEITISFVKGIMKIPNFVTTRKDLSAYKRVELHCHTKMSDMDAISEASDIVARAHQWGHRAIAITDHGVTQGFPHANKTWSGLWKDEKKKKRRGGAEESR